MRSVINGSHILPFAPRAAALAKAACRTEVGPLARVELHQVERDEIQSLRTRLLELILDNERARKVARFRLVN